MGQVEQLEAAVAALKEAEGKRAIAVAIAEDRDLRRQENEAALKEIIEKYRGLLDEQNKITKQAIDRVESLQSQQKWLLFGGIIAGLAALAVFFGLGL